MDDTVPAEFDTLDVSVGIIAAFVSNNSVRASDLPALIVSVHAAITGLANGSATAASTAEPETAKATPAQIRKSITPDALISFVDGKPYKTLKRHLGTHGLDLAAYRARYGLPADYPSVAPSYSASRSALAKSFGLGNFRGNAATEGAEPIETVAEKPKRGRSAELVV